MGAPTLSRRALLAAAAAAPAACAIPAIASPSPFDWHRLKQRVIDTLAAERHYDSTVMMPAWNAERERGA